MNIFWIVLCVLVMGCTVAGFATLTKSFKNVDNMGDTFIVIGIVFYMVAIVAICAKVALENLAAIGG